MLLYHFAAKLFLCKQFVAVLVARCSFPNFNCTYCYQKAYKYQSEFSSFIIKGDIKAIHAYINHPRFDVSDLKENTISGGEPLLQKILTRSSAFLTPFRQNSLKCLPME